MGMLLHRHYEVEQANQQKAAKKPVSAPLAEQGDNIPTEQKKRGGRPKKA